MKFKSFLDFSAFWGTNPNLPYMKSALLSLSYHIYVSLSLSFSLKGKKYKTSVLTESPQSVRHDITMQIQDADREVLVLVAPVEDVPYQVPVDDFWLFPLELYEWVRAVADVGDAWRGGYWRGKYNKVFLRVLKSKT